jgi:long-chain acyl-CoA synthetase
MLQLKDYIADWPDIDYPNFRAWLDAALKNWPEREALRFRAGTNTEFETWSYARLAAEVKAIGRMLLASGAKKGDRVAIWSENRPQWCAAWLGAVTSGLTAVPLDFSLTEAEIESILKACEPFALFISSHRAANLPAFRKAAPSLRQCLVFPEGSAPYAEPDASGAPGERAYLSAMKGDWKADLPDESALKPDDIASIIFTSGTTGLAKGVMLSHHGIIANVNASIMSLPIWKEDVFMDVLPLHHTYPTTCCFISPLTVGASVTICEKVVGKVILADARDSGGTILIGVPLLYDKLMAGLKQNFKAQPAVARGLIAALFGLSRFFGRAGWQGFGKAAFGGIRKKAGLSTIRLMVAGGGPLNPRTADFFNEFGVCMVQGYGMSENGPLITTNTTRYKDPASAGLRVKYTEIKILDPDPEGIGEIIVTSPSLMMGYYKNAEGTKAVFTDTGWLKTGDLGYLDERGFLFITGRSKNLIVSSGGKNIFPEEIEQKFDGSRAIAELLVLGRKHGGSDNAEDVIAVCVPHYEAIKEDHPGKETDPAFVRALVEAQVQAVNRGLAPYKKIVEIFVRENEFEKTSSKKIKRYLYSGEYGKR